MMQFANSFNEKMVTEIISKKVNEPVKIIHEFNAKYFGPVFKIYFEESNQIAIIECYDLDIDIRQDYDLGVLIERLIEELQKTHSMLFI